LHTLVSFSRQRLGHSKYIAKVPVSEKNNLFRLFKQKTPLFPVTQKSPANGQLAARALAGAFRCFLFLYRLVRSACWTVPALVRYGRASTEPNGLLTSSDPVLLRANGQLAAEALAGAFRCFLSPYRPVRSACWTVPALVPYTINPTTYYLLYRDCCTPGLY
jgi:hypothetical protein